MHVVTIRRHYKDTVYENHLLRRSYREDGKVKNETVGNLSHLPPELIEIIRRALKGETFLGASEAFELTRSLPHGDAAAVYAEARTLGFPETLGPACRERDLAFALLIARVLRPASKLESGRYLSDTALGQDLQVAGDDPDALYGALDWLGSRQETVERSLARRHLTSGGLVLVDLSSSYLTGSHCPLGARGYSRDGRRGTLQITYGLITTAEGCPVCVEVFPGNLSDPQAFSAALLAVADMLSCTEAELHKVKDAVAAGRVKSAAAIGLRAGRVLNRFKMAKHFSLTIAEGEFTYARKEDQIRAEAALDGIYVIRTNVPEETFFAQEVVTAYKRLARVEDAFRSLKSVDLEVRPIYHRLEERVRAHVFLCMLAEYLVFHLRAAWAPLTFADEQKNEPRADAVAQARRSEAAEVKARTRKTEKGTIVYSFRGLLAHLATLTRNTIRLPAQAGVTFERLSEPTPLQRRAFELLGVPIPLHFR